MICKISIDILDKLRTMKQSYKTMDDEKFVITIIDKINIPLEENVKSIILKQVLKNIDMDIFLEERKLILNKQKIELGLQEV